MIGKTNANIGGGPGSENVNVHITSNQSNTSDLIGVTVTLTIEEDGTTETKVWEGSDLLFNVPEYASYVISFSTINGYATPANYSSTATADNSVTVTGTYQTTVLTVLMADNQDDYDDISGATAVVTATGISATTVSSGGTVKVPTGVTDCKITWSDVTNYKTPTLSAFTTSGTAMSKTGTYQTEVVTVTVTADAGGSVSEQTVTINGVTTTLTSAGTVTQKVAYGTSYTVYLNSKTNYNLTSTQTFTASQASRSVTMAYTIKKETLTVKVSGLSSGFTITVKSGSTTIGTQTSTSKSYTIDYGTSYTVSASTVDGYDVSPATFTRTAASSTYSHTITYTSQEIANGIYVVMSNGMCYPSSSSASGAVGVAVVTDNCCFIMGLSYTGGIPWAASSLSNYNSDISAVPTSTSSSTIATYYDGVSYTDSILSFFSGESTSTCAASKARSQSITFKSSTLSGYLGSAGEWQAVIDNYSTVQTALTNAGGFTIDWDNGTYYWTSCEYDSSYAWRAYFYSSVLGLNNYGKDYSHSYYCVVPFYKVDKSDLIAA